MRQSVGDCEFEELEHTAEVGVRVQATDSAELYACSAQAMFALLHAEPDTTAVAESHQIIVDSTDAECLMVDWLSELLYIHETNGVVMTNCTVTHWSPTRLEASVIGHPPTQPPSMDIKAVTFHQLSIQQTDDCWTAEVFFDI